MKIFVIKNSIHIGSLSEDNNGNITFIYSEGISAKQYLVGLADKINISKVLFPVFENLLPEYEQLELIRVKNQIKRKIDLLLYLNNIHGSFEFYRENEFLEITSRKNSTFNYLVVKHEILKNDYVYPNILQNYKLDIPDDKLYHVGISGSKVTGLSGYQYKFSVYKDDQLKKISVCEEKDSEFFIKPYNLNYAKFAPKTTDNIYIPHLLINEHIFMTLARDFGFDIPYNAIIKHNDNYHYIIKRYDRYNGLKIDHCEALTLLGKQSSGKYEVSCKNIIEEVQKYLTQNEMLQVYRFLVFSIIISHGDLHGKNISLIYKSNSLDEKGMTLSPFYDISTTKIYKNLGPNDIGIMVKNKKKEITLDDLLWLAQVSNIKKSIAESVIVNITSRFIKEFQTYIQLLPKEIKELPVYKKRSIYGYSDHLEDVLNKFYESRYNYIKKYLPYSAIVADNSLWK